MVDRCNRTVERLADRYRQAGHSAGHNRHGKLLKLKRSARIKLRLYWRESIVWQLKLVLLFDHLYNYVVQVNFYK